MTPAASGDAGLRIGVDVGGTKILAGVLSTQATTRRRLTRQAMRPTPSRTAPVEELEEAVRAVVVEVADGRTIAAVGIAAAGFVDPSGERVMFAPHLAWQGEDVRARMSVALGAPVVLDNDANAAGWAEALFGAGRGASCALTVTVGTGIGGATVLDLGDGPRLLRGSNGMAGEFGHQRLVPDGCACACGGRGCWEMYASGNALVARARAALRGSSATVLAQWSDGDPQRIEGPMVTAAAQAGDEVALRVLGEVGTWLGRGLAGLTAAYDPDVFVIGGGVSAAGELLLAPARVALAESVVGAGHRRLPSVRVAELGPAAAMIGAAALAAG